MEYSMFINEDYPLPFWAEKRSEGLYMIRNTQLETRDGRRCGNAVVKEILWSNKLYFNYGLEGYALVITDIGSKLEYTLNELKEFFHKPRYIMKRADLEEKF